MIEKDIAALRRYAKRLKSISFLVSQNTDGTVRVRFGKKLILFDAPNREYALIIKGQFETIIKDNASKVEQIIDMAEKRCEQLKLELFGNGEEDGAKGYCEEVGTSV